MGKRGEKVRQRVEVRYEWAHLVLGVDPTRKRLMWAWLERVRDVELAEVLRGWKAQGVVRLVWDNAAFHRSRAVGEVDVSGRRIPLRWIRWSGQRGSSAACGGADVWECRGEEGGGGGGASAVGGRGTAFHAGGVGVCPGSLPSFTQMIKILFDLDWYYTEGPTCIQRVFGSDWYNTDSYSEKGLCISKRDGIQRGLMTYF